MKFTNSKYLKKVREMPCIACTIKKEQITKSAEAHHESVSLKFKNYKRMFDYGAVPLCSEHHELRHRLGSKIFWEHIGGDYRLPFFVVIKLLEKYLKMLRVSIPAALERELTRRDYYQYNEYKLRKLIDTLAVLVRKENINEST